MAHKTALLLAAHREAHIIGYGDHIGAPSAAYPANGLMAHCLEVDDTHSETLVHASVTTVTTALAAGELAGASGKEVMTALLARTNWRVASASSPRCASQRMDSTPRDCRRFFRDLSRVPTARFERQIDAPCRGIAGSMTRGKP